MQGNDTSDALTLGPHSHDVTTLNVHAETTGSGGAQAGQDDDGKPGKESRTAVSTFE